MQKGKGMLKRPRKSEQGERKKDVGSEEKETSDCTVRPGQITLGKWGKQIDRILTSPGCKKPRRKESSQDRVIFRPQEDRSQNRVRS